MLILHQASPMKLAQAPTTRPAATVSGAGPRVTTNSESRLQSPSAFLGNYTTPRTSADIVADIAKTNTDSNADKSRKDDKIKDVRPNKSAQLKARSVCIDMIPIKAYSLEVPSTAATQLPFPLYDKSTVSSRDGIAQADSVREGRALA
ncbi:hypothetical protein K438DRAFT_1757254 [Mycena galopus ATCC 62051]|nr:hypothetical protein K438DRAFT_1757254 [Mycena galopus ATCC 62051]